MLSSIAQLLDISEQQVMHHQDLLINAFDNEHRILFWNNKCEEYFGIPQHVAIGRVLEDLIPSTRNNPKMKSLETAFLGKTVFIADRKYEKKNAHYSQILLPIKDNDGNVIAVINLVRTLRHSANKGTNELFSNLFKNFEPEN